VDGTRIRDSDKWKQSGTNLPKLLTPLMIVKMTVPRIITLCIYACVLRQDAGFMTYVQRRGDCGLAVYLTGLRWNGAGMDSQNDTTRTYRRAARRSFRSLLRASSIAEQGPNDVS
jgi:hypothetical protein